MAFPIVLSAMIGIGLLVGAVASSMRRSFLAWSVYGAIVPIAAVPHLLFLRHRSDDRDWTPVRYGLPGNARLCPHCGAGVHNDAVVCRSCQTPLYGPGHEAAKNEDKTAKSGVDVPKDNFQFGKFWEKGCPSCDDVDTAENKEKPFTARKTTGSPDREPASAFRASHQDQKKSATVDAPEVPIMTPRPPIGFGRLAFGGIVAVLCVIVAAVVWAPLVNNENAPEIAGLRDSDPGSIPPAGTDTVEAEPQIQPLPSPKPAEPDGESDMPPPEPETEIPDQNTTAADDLVTHEDSPETAAAPDTRKAVEPPPAPPEIRPRAKVADEVSAKPEISGADSTAPAQAPQTTSAVQSKPATAVKAGPEPQSGTGIETVIPSAPEENSENVTDMHPSADPSANTAEAGDALTVEKELETASVTPESAGSTDVQKPAFAETIRAALNKVNAGDVPGDRSGITAVGELVWDVQYALKSRGYDPGPVDGSAGHQTRAAIRNLQENMNMEVTGEISPEVLVILGLAQKGAHNIKIGTPLGNSGQPER